MPTVSVPRGVQVPRYSYTRSTVDLVLMRTDVEMQIPMVRGEASYGVGGRGMCRTLFVSSVRNN